MFGKSTPRAWTHRYAGDEADCIVISSRGLMKLCPARTRPIPGNYPALSLRLSRHAPGGAIYVHTELLNRFRRWYLPWVRSPFTLVTGDSAEQVGPPWVKPETRDAIARHPQLRGWFVQNNPGDGPAAMDYLPVGLDYHTLAVGRQTAWGAHATPKQQEAALDAVRRAAPPLAERVVKASCNAHLNGTHPSRDGLTERLSPDVVDFQSQPIPRRPYWQMCATYAATVSPRGYGMDCHRTWEALVLGALPLVDKLPTNSLLQGLPHHVVPDWSAFTGAQLRAAWQRAQSEVYDFAPLLLAYWADRFAGRPVARLRMLYQDFLNTPLDELRKAYLSGSRA